MPRSGYTLLELCIVMAIIVVLATMTIPLYDALVHPNKLESARDLVRGNLAEMRGRAMTESRAYRFQVLENTGEFKIEPIDTISQADNAMPGWFHKDTLPEPILFTLGPGGANPSSGSDWPTVVIYLPDGSAQDSKTIRFNMDGQRPLILRIRELTGAVSAPDPGAPEEDER